MTNGDDNQPDTETTFRPIPDGGLADSLPGWLKERPAWSVDGTSVSTLLPDHSVIDPRRLVHDEDLPEWLRAIALRGINTVELPNLVIDDLDEDAQPVESHIEPTLDDALPQYSPPPTKPEWMTHAASPPLIPQESMGDMKQWLSSGETLPEQRQFWRDPVVLGFAAAGFLVIVVALYLLLS